MKKFIITEEERGRILGMHKSATARQYLMEQVAIYNWTDPSTKRVLKYKVQNNKYYTSRDEGKTWTEITKPTDIEWVKSNAIKPENQDKSAQAKSTPQGKPITVGTKFVLAAQNGNQLYHFNSYQKDKPKNQIDSAKPVSCTINSIKFLTNGVDIRINAFAHNGTAEISYIVDCKGTYSATPIKTFTLSDRYFITGSDLESSNIQGSPYTGSFGEAFNNINGKYMNKPLFDAALNYYCDNGKLRSSFQPANKAQSQF
jgi:hypothetical protein